MRLLDPYSSFNGVRDSNGPAFYSVDFDQRMPHNTDRYTHGQTQIGTHERNEGDHIQVQFPDGNVPFQNGRLNPYNHRPSNRRSNDSSSQVWDESSGQVYESSGQVRNNALSQLSDYSTSQLSNQFRYQWSSNRSDGVVSNQIPGRCSGQNRNGIYQPYHLNGSEKDMFEQAMSQSDSFSTSNSLDYDALPRNGAKVRRSSNFINSDLEDGNSRNSLDSRSIYIGNVDYGANPLDLQRHFRACGVVERITIMTNKETGQPKGYAYLEFDLHLAAKDAVKMLDRSEFLGRELKVCLKRTNVPGHSHAGHGYYRGRGRGRGGRRGRGRGSRMSFAPY